MEIKVGDKVRVREDAPRVYLKGSVFDYTEHQSAVHELDGDALWYAANLAHALDCTLDEVAEMNLNKIHNRLLRGKLHGSGDNR